MAKLDLNSLNDEHVKLLINELKYPETHIDVNELKTIVASRINERQEIISFKLGIKYLLTIKRGNIEKDRFSISIIFKDTYHTLVRIDINGGTHDIQMEQSLRKVIFTYIMISMIKRIGLLMKLT